MVPPNQRKRAFRRPSAHPNLPKRMVRRFGGLIIKFGASGLSKHAFQMFCVPLNLLKFAFQMFSMRSKSPKRGLGTPLVFFVIFVPLGTCIQEYSGSNPFSSIKFEALETHFRHLAQACPLILNHVSEMLFGISQALA